MSAFKALRDVSNSFEEDLRRISNELFTANVTETFEDGIEKKLRDLSLHSSKLRLLQAKSIAASPEIANQQKDQGTTIADYGDTVKGKLVEQQVVKAITQSHAVKALITANDSSLDPDMLERKEKIIDQLTKYKDKERQLMHLEAVLKARQQQLEEVRREWDHLLGLLREMRTDGSDTIQDDGSNPLSSKLQALQGKARLMRALLARLAAGRAAGYDWLADPHRRLRALQLARR